MNQESNLPGAPSIHDGGQASRADVNIVLQVGHDVSHSTLPLSLTLSTSAAASVEAFYRSGMNNLINRRLLGTTGSFFPLMHIQVPVRVLYINGFKGIRYLVDKNFDTKNATTSQKLMAYCAPGVIMTPISSILEASNAHMNTEPMISKWTRGLLPRGGREVIFGIGINQMSDWFGARMTWENKALNTLSGSLLAGVISGYLSHVPHNLSALKLQYPHRNYRDIFNDMVALSAKRLPANIPAREACGAILSVVAPVGVLIRTSQVVGSFVILNGIIHALTR